MSKRVLVVDDSRLAYMDAQRNLEGSEFEIVGYCQDGESALAQYEEIMPDVVLMDIIMPGQSGLEVSAVLRQLYPESVIIVVSSLDDDDAMKYAAAIGCKGICKKPLERGQLLETMRAALQRGEVKI